MKAENERGQRKRRKLWKDNVKKLECKGMADEYENMRYMMERFSSQTFFFFLFSFIYIKISFFSQPLSTFWPQGVFSICT